MSRVPSPALGSPPQNADRFGLNVQRLPKDLAGLEGQHPSCRDGDLVAGLGVSPPPGFLLLDDKISKTGNLDLLTRCQVVLNDIEYGLNNPRRILLRKSQLFVHILNN